MKNWLTVIYIIATALFLFLLITGLISGSSGWIAALALVALGLFRLLGRR